MNDKICGCLLGGAMGDALGYAVEFMSYPGIVARYGEKGITAYELHDGKAMISDDTQMTLFTAEGLLKAKQSGKTVLSCVYSSYINWLHTQGGTNRFEKDSYLLAYPDLFSRRAPGNTCLNALESGDCGTTDEPINNSKGCGGVMRTAPAGMILTSSPEEAALHGAETAAITHCHYMGYIPAAALSCIVYNCLHSEAELCEILDSSMETVYRLYSDCPVIGGFRSLCEKAKAFATQNTDDASAIHSIGGGWVGDEALAIALYCAYKYQDGFSSALIASVNHSGDSDSTGAILGNILGAYLGAEKLPREYKEHLELADCIADTAARLSENA